MNTVIAYLIFSPINVPPELVTLILSVFFPSIPNILSLLHDYIVRLKPIEMKSIAFDVISHARNTGDLEMFLNYPIPYESLLKYVQSIPIEFHNKTDKHLVVQAIWLEVFPDYPYPWFTLNPFKRRKLLAKPIKIGDFGLKETLPFNLPPKQPKIIFLPTFNLLAIIDALIKVPVKRQISVPSARFVVKHSDGTHYSDVFGLGRFHDFYQLMVRSLAQRNLQLLVHKAIEEGIPPKKLYRDTLQMYKGLGYDEIIASQSLLWHLKKYYPDQNDCIKYVNEKFNAILKPLTEMIDRALKEKPKTTRRNLE